jgi:NADH dehydrogenase
MVADVTLPDTIAAAVNGAQWVINLVGILYERGQRTFERIHVEGARNVAQAAANAGAERLIQMSAIGADAASPAEYGRTKAAGEDAARGAFPGVSVVRPSIIFGPEDDFFNRFAAMARFLPVLPVFETRFQPVYVGDVAEAMMRILNNPATAGKTYELGGPRVLDFRACMEVMLKAIGRQRLLAPIPVSIASFQAFFLELLPVPPLTRDQVKLLGRDNVVAESALKLADLNVVPTDVEVILPTYLARFQSQVHPLLRRMR